MSTWSFDPSHSSVNFSVRHIMISKVRGSFKKWSGTFDYNESDPTQSRIEVHIDASSIDTAEERRDGHLKSPDFFDVAKYPELVFKSSGITRDGDGFKVAGDLTIHGVTKAVTLDVDSLGASKDHFGNDRVGFEAKTSISRKAFGLEWNAALETGGVVVGDKIEIEIDLQALKPKA